MPSKETITIDEPLAEYLKDQKQPLIGALEKWPGNKQELLEAAIRLLDARVVNVKNRAAKFLVRAAKADPAAAAFAIPQLVEHLASPDKIVLWNTALTLSHLSAVSTPEQTRRFLPKILKLLQDDSMVTAANAIKSLGRIARRRPRMAKRVTEQLIQADHSFRKPKCQWILAGKVIDEFRKYGRGASYEPLILQFVEQQQASPRVATMSRARRFLRRHAPDRLNPPPRSRRPSISNSPNS